MTLNTHHVSAVGAGTDRTEPVRISELLVQADGAIDDVTVWSVQPTGLSVLDRVLSGGLRTHDLVILGGVPGVGKTIAALQVARNAARDGGQVVYVCYEHDARVLLGRLLLLELGEADSRVSPLELEELGGQIRDAVMTPAGLRELSNDPRVAGARSRLAEYAERLLLVPASGAHTGLAEIEALVTSDGSGCSLLVVDYLQKVAVHPEPATEADKVTRVTEGLKDLALAHDTTVLAIVAADRTALEANRVRLHHLRGSSALAYEADVAVILNDKFQCVSRVHLSYDTVRAAQFRDWVVFTVEKNRGGPAQMDVEFHKDFAFYRFHADGRYVQERLIDERLVLE